MLDVQGDAWKRLCDQFLAGFKKDGPFGRIGRYLDPIMRFGNVPSFVEIGRAVAAVGVTTRLLVACQRSECLFSLIAR